ncbi:DUF3800 domain-containing protein [Sulfuricurvum sp.]|uniref:DUF3800 domain-containing protein n=1 Tax=Sulfuricurvum sp. TaxID=2025608 RepID=UPI00286E15AE|nr:DUF3800 domain-containing protein [Sulfuricurvum sp.]
MAYLYFDESMREKGEFIVGALVVSDADISSEIREQWSLMGLHPSDEYKSCSIKNDNIHQQNKRLVINNYLHESQLAMLVAPLKDRRNLGKYCVELVIQLVTTECLVGSEHFLFLDDNIKVSESDRDRLKNLNIECYSKCDSAKIAGIQVADHAAHLLGSILLQAMGIFNKQVKAGENSGYDPDTLIDLDFELWANMRYSFIGKNEYIEGHSSLFEENSNPFFKIEGYGLFVAPTCPEELVKSTLNSFGINYLGCIH